MGDGLSEPPPPLISRAEKSGADGLLHIVPCKDVIALVSAGSFALQRPNYRRKKCNTINFVFSVFISKLFMKLINKFSKSVYIIIQIIHINDINEKKRTQDGSLGIPSYIGAFKEYTFVLVLFTFVGLQTERVLLKNVALLANDV